MNVLDFVLIGFVAFMAFKAYRKGFMVSLLQLLSVVIALVIAKLYHIKFADFIFNTFGGFREKVYDRIEDFVIKYLPQGGAGDFDFGEILDQFFPQGSNLPGIPGGRSGALYDGAVDVLTQRIATFIINCISFLILFVLVMVLIEILIIIFSRLRSLPVIGSFDRALGLALGAVQGILIAMVVLFIITRVGRTGELAAYAKLVDESLLCSKLANMGLLDGLIKNIMDIAVKKFS